MTTEDRIQKTGQNAPQTHTFEIPLSLSGFVAESTSFYLCVFPGPWGWALCGFVICAFVPLHLLPSFLCVLWALCGSECESIMQNKANFKMGKMALNPCCERHYGDISSLSPRQNKANQSQFQTIKPNFRRSSVVLQDYPSGEMVRAFDSRVGSVRHRVGTKHGLKARATTAKMAVLWQAGGGGSGGDPVVWVVSVKGGVGSYY